MAIPRVFVSSTCYDLKYIRENLNYFIKTIGYEPVLSEEGSVYFDPSLHVQDACLTEVPNCQLFVLIIGGRFGANYKETKKSITNAEYNEAIKCKTPVFALIEEQVYSQFHVFLQNQANTDIDETKIKYPSIDNAKIFDFVNEVRKNAINNALQPFKDFADIESYLRQQWAGMMFSFLIHSNEDKRVADTLGQLSIMNDRIEFLSNQILDSVGTQPAKAMAELYDLMLEYDSTKGLISTGHKPGPKAILINDNLASCAESLGNSLTVIEEADFITTSSGEIEKMHYEKLAADYKKMRSAMLKEIAKRGLAVEDLIKGE